MNEFNFKRRNSLKSIVALGTAGSLGAWSSLVSAQKALTVGVIYVGAKDDFGYNQAQAEAAAELKKMPGIKVVEEENVAETVAVQKTMTGMIVQDGATLLFPSSFGYFDPHVLAVAAKYPNIRFAHCGGLWTEGKHPKNVGSYFGYIDECQYLNGIIAGHMTKSNKIAFIAAKPIPQVLRNINAFTLGARSVKPNITCSVIFTGDWSMPVKEAEATNSLADQGCDVFTMHVDGPKVVVETAAKRGKMVCGYHASQARLAPNAYLTGAEWNWLTAYKTMIDAARSGKPHPNLLRGGLKEGYVKMSPYGSMVTAAAKSQADKVRAQMVAGKFDIFKGGLKDNKGATVIPAGKTYRQTDIELEKMNYLVEGVLGSV
ncbi:MAG: BMP family ABC transporter substrate-binding protein [Burkholderiales bacterium]|jgi:basic membrane protein A|nr:BMP family ABC transporter substrate-binding protein [Burkholderiales bacterium]MCA3155204.1 BMP family ABC transporter substrate-binding protein [Burkholderiales bacterium]MCA3156808.1 BMP family ABC transporter substrate-binding protein [Burkholderiales bacterium]MCA3167229.1 BMP family ABC transporter substrate-binding protein [Burkholderiales bacterium]